MDRRLFLSLLLFGFTKQKRFIFKIRTKDGNIVGNISIRAKDVEAAKVKLEDRYPGCKILSVETEE